MAIQIRSNRIRGVPHPIGRFEADLHAECSKITTLIKKDMFGNKIAVMFLGLGKQIGEVHFYTGLEAFFNRIFGAAMRVNFSGKELTVDKANYLRLVNRVFGRNVRRSDLPDYRNLQQSLERATTIILTNNYARNEVDPLTKQNRFVQLIKAIDTGNDEAAFNCIAKGAALDRYIFYRNDTQEYYFDRRDVQLATKTKLKDRGSVPLVDSITIEETTPLLLAAKRNRWRIVNYLLAAGAKSLLKEKRVTFKRSVTSIPRTTRNDEILTAVGISESATTVTLQNYLSAEPE